LVSNTRTIAVAFAVLALSLTPITAQAQSSMASPAIDATPSVTSPTAAPNAATPTPQPASPAPNLAPATPVEASPIQSSPVQSSPVESHPVEASAAEVSPLPHELTPIGMFMAADYIVKAVMIGLAFASVVTWSVWLAKMIEMLSARRKLVRDLHKVENSRSLEEARTKLQGANSDVAVLTSAALEELRRSQDAMNHDGIKERVASLFNRIEAAATRRMTRGTSILATIG
jgi:biopolymer transport protein ExbB